jgi:hypothetical protein
VVNSEKVGTVDADQLLTCSLYCGFDPSDHHRLDYLLDARRRCQREHIWGETVVSSRRYQHSARARLISFSKITDVVATIYEAAIHLPKPVRRVCIVQIAAFMGWFPYLFYSTTYVAEVMAIELGHQPDRDAATRAGSLALLIYSFGKGYLLVDSNILTVCQSRLLLEPFCPT